MAKPHSELSPRPHQWFWRKGIHMVHVSGGDEHVVALDFNGYLSALLYRRMDSEEFCGKERAHKRHSIQHKTVDMDLQQAYIGDQSIIIYSKYQYAWSLLSYHSRMVSTSAATVLVVERDGVSQGCERKHKGQISFQQHDAHEEVALEELVND
ncbi:hypothetical protein Tco_1095055 [Tanacetum coccineum]